ncbi:MAG: Smr/MutS family protein [Cystobacterineae bacterium]|nr:Smr/MutS family protein [Cystobacterineae bacterium]
MSHLSTSTQANLRYADILSALALRCQTPLGEERALHRPFLDSLELAREAMALIEEARCLLQEPLRLPFADLSDGREEVERAAKGAILDTKALLSLMRALFVFEQTSALLEEREALLPRLGVLGQHIPVLSAVASQLEKSIELNGDIRDTASEALYEARRRTRALHRSIKTKLEALLANPKFASNLRENYFSIRNNRYVVPVQTQHQAEVPGIVHNSSQTGQTLFVEPQALVSLGNELAIAQAEVEEEERRILAELSSKIGAHADALLAGFQACAKLDEAQAAAILAEDMQAASPKLLEPACNQELRLHHVRHPLLLLQKTDVIANDALLESPARALVISGPNAGGKTITLTAVGLCALMARAGLLIPAQASSQMPFYPSIHALVGDAQDLSLGLSTFSAHIQALSHICDKAIPHSLVLIDEIAAGTAVREGAALATAILETLLEKSAHVFVTTHLEELKALAHVDKRLSNARVGFDENGMLPTYRLHLGSAGNSSAIDIARRVGLAPSICERAHALSQNSGSALGTALAEVAAAKEAAWAEQKTFLKEREAAQKLRVEFEAKLEEANKKRTADEIEFRRALHAELEFARKHIATLLEALREEKNAKRLHEAQTEVYARIQEQQHQLHLAKHPKGAQSPLPATFAVGSTAFFPPWGVSVEIVETSDTHATISAGMLRSRVALAELHPTSAKPALPPSPRAFGQEEESPSTTCDVRGMRQEDALRVVEQFLDKAMQAAQERICIVHGHGTGALKSSLRKYLSTSPYAKNFRAGETGEGGDGVTFVFLAL